MALDPASGAITGLGHLGEYLARMYFRTVERTHYVAQEQSNLFLLERSPRERFTFPWKSSWILKAPDQVPQPTVPAGATAVFHR